MNVGFLSQFPAPAYSSLRIVLRGQLFCAFGGKPLPSQPQHAAATRGPRAAMSTRRAQHLPLHMLVKLPFNSTHHLANHHEPPYKHPHCVVVNCTPARQRLVHLPGAVHLEACVFWAGLCSGGQARCHRSHDEGCASCSTPVSMLSRMVNHSFCVIIAS